jgi:hypothetical protein
MYPFFSISWGGGCKIGWFMVFNATFNNISVISWRSVFLVEETGVPEESIDLSQGAK